MTTLPSFEDIKQAHARIAPHVHRTPIVRSAALDAWAGHEVALKAEHLQKVGAFKIRGATNAVLRLTEAERQRGVAAHSSGNHAQALALAARQAGISAHIVMPEDAPSVKVDAVRGYGAEITFCTPSAAARSETVATVIANTGATEIHPFDNVDVIAGQATVAIEMIEDTPGLEVILAPVGGGGLISGVALAASELAPSIALIGAEPKAADDAARSLATGVLQPAPDPVTIADGLRTGLSERTFSVVRQHLDRIITVTEEEIVDAMRFTWMRTKMLVEPSGAVAIAALRKLGGASQSVGVIISGGNVDLDKLPW